MNTHGARYMYVVSPVSPSSRVLFVQDQSTPLHVAAANGHNTCVSTLLQAGAQADARDKVSSYEY